MTWNVLALEMLLEDDMETDKPLDIEMRTSVEIQSRILA